MSSTEAVWDGGWHHVAMIIEQNVGTTALRLMFDGEVVATSTYAQGPITAAGTQLYIGNTKTIAAPAGLKGDLDDLRISTRAIPVDELRGYYRTGRAHGDLLWDSGAVGACAPSPCPIGTDIRLSDLSYAGPAQLLLNGARYWVTTQLRTDATATPASTWSTWSEPDWFETHTADTLSVTSPTTVNLGPASPAVDATATTSVDVSTNGGNGYSLYGYEQSDTWALSSGTATVPRWTGGPAVPSSWASGAPGAGYFGVTVLAATGTKDVSRWGTGSTATDFGNLKYAGLKHTTSTLLHKRSTYAATTDTVTIGWRLNAPLGLKPGSYEGTFSMVAVANP